MKIRRYAMGAAIVLSLSSGGSSMAEDASIVRVWDFNRGIYTDQGGYYNHFSAGGSDTELHLVREPVRGHAGRSLEINYTKAPSGYCGVWFHTFDESAADEPIRYLDVFDHPYLSFWIKGAEGGEMLSIQMADAEWYHKEDSKAAGLITKYLPDGVTTNWQEVTIPFDDFGLSAPRVATITLNFTEEGAGTIFIDDLYFKKSAAGEVPLSASIDSSEKRDRIERAMWVWETVPLLKDPTARSEFFDFCHEHAITELFLQLPYSFENDLTADVICRIQHADELGEFIAESRERELLVHALDGYPEFVLREHHPRVMAQVDAVIDFIEAREAPERFYGVHLDNEPYQLMGFEGPQRESILLQFLELNAKVMDRIRERGSAVVYGIDIPFWFDEGSEADGSDCLVTFNGVRKDAAKHLIDLLDNVGIMDYRNFAGEADGMIRHAEGEIAYGNKVGKKIYLGLETFTYRPTTIHFIYGPTEAKWLELGSSGKHFQLNSVVDGFHVRVLKAGDYRLIGLAEPAELEDEKGFRTALRKLYAIYGATVHDPDLSVDAVSFDAEFAISRDGRYTGFSEFRQTGEADSTVAAGFTTTELMLEKITFADKSKADMERVMEEVADEYHDDASFLGFAIHYYKTYRALPDR